MDAPDKNTKLSGKDQATAIVTLWNAMSANDKFSSLSAEDKATALVSIWNGLTAEQKRQLLMEIVLLRIRQFQKLMLKNKR